MIDKEKRARKYMQKMRHKTRLERQAKNWRAYPNAAVWMDEQYIGNGQYEQIEKPYAKKLYLSSNCQRYKFYKRHSNRKVRRTSTYIPNGNGYRKIFDYAWEID